MLLDACGLRAFRRQCWSEVRGELVARVIDYVRASPYDRHMTLSLVASFSRTFWWTCGVTFALRNGRQWPALIRRQAGDVCVELRALKREGEISLVTLVFI
jgi:hypothetical protein